MSSLNLSEASHSATPGVKPVDRDDFVQKVDEPSERPQLDHDQAIAAICSQEELTEPQSTKLSQDEWIKSKHDGLWIRQHNRKRRALESPSTMTEGPNLSQLASMRFTLGTYHTGEKFTYYDRWRNHESANRELTKPWTGYTVFFDRDNDNIDMQIASLCSSLQEEDIVMTQKKLVRFNEALTTFHEVRRYADCYTEHPHFLLATSQGWKKNPARADFFTGKSALVMRERRKSIRARMRPKSAHQRRLQLMEQANAALSLEVGMGRNDRPSNEGKDRHMDIDTDDEHYDTDVETSDAMSIDVHTHFAEEEPDQHSPIMSAAKRTKPVGNKYQKRVGAKKAKKLEVDQNSSGALSPSDATMYRALAARCNYLSQDRPDISFASKELCREFNIPCVSSFKKLKRLVRYLCGLPRLVYHYDFQSAPKQLDAYVDTDFAGCKGTRRSTSGGVLMVGSHCIKHYSKTQTTISLSSGEAELHGIANGCAQILGIRSLMRDMHWSMPLVVHSDATAAIGIARRKGLGKIRHLDVTDLWIQDKIRSKEIQVVKVLGTDNPADALTKYVERASLEKALAKMNVHKTSGRPTCAPVAMGA